MKILRSVRWTILTAVVMVATLISAQTNPPQQGEVTTTGKETAGVYIESLANFPDVILKTGNATSSAVRLFNSANAELLRVSASGNVGIGTGTAIPTQKLEIFNGTAAGAVVLSTPLNATFPTNSGIGGLRLAWKYGGSASNNVDLQVVRGFDAVDGAGLAIFTSPNNGSTLERMRITSAGRIGIGTGTITPTGRTMIYNTESNLKALVSQQQVGYSVDTTAYDNAIAGLVNLYMPAGAKDLGHISGLMAQSFLFGAGSVHGAYGVLAEASVYPGTANTGSITTAYGVFSRVAKYNGAITTGYGVYVEDVTATNDYGIYQAGADDSNVFAGDVTVGAAGATGTKLTVNGNVAVSGSITGATVIGAVYQDLAEWVPASTAMETGTVVVLNHERINEVMPSHRAYDTSVAGVVSARPGILLGVPGESKERIATTGRVKVRVDASHGSIAVGDLLVSGDKPGTAMKSIPVEVGGVAMHRPGTIVGKALEPLESGQGEILVLLSLQ